MVDNLLKGKTGKWEIVIGLEVHAQIASQSKLFSRSKIGFGAEPNTQVSLIDAAMPGMLPVINKKCVEQAIKTGLGINAQINTRSVFDRKNYFYADLPQGYQISQFKDPIVGEGNIDIETKEYDKNIRIERIHLEQDAGKSMHDQSPEHSMIDLNRSGVALMELVTFPDMRSAEEAGAFMKKFRSIVRYLGTSDGDMEKGNMRCDANVSVRREGVETLGTRNEIKNLNSIKNIIAAINYEAKRQIEVLEDGGTIEQATRLFNVEEGVTKVMRSKEDAHDYRYFPDPDLYPLEFEQSWVDELASQLPELPDAKKERYIKDFGLTKYDAGVIVEDKKVAGYYEQVAEIDPKLACVWITGELFSRLNKASINFDNNPISAENIGELISLIKDNTISGKIAKDVLDFMMEEPSKKPSEIVEEKGLKQVTDTGAIEKVIDEVIANNQKQYEQYKGGAEKLFGFFVGQVMKATQGKANPAAVNELLKKKL